MAPRLAGLDSLTLKAFGVPLSGGGAFLLANEVTGQVEIAAPIALGTAIVSAVTPHVPFKFQAQLAMRRVSRGNAFFEAEAKGALSEPFVVKIGVPDSTLKYESGRWSLPRGQRFPDAFVEMMLQHLPNAVFPKLRPYLAQQSLTAIRVAVGSKFARLQSSEIGNKYQIRALQDEDDKTRARFLTLDHLALQGRFAPTVLRALASCQDGELDSDLDEDLERLCVALQTLTSTKSSEWHYTRVSSQSPGRFLKMAVDRVVALEDGGQNIRNVQERLEAYQAARFEKVALFANPKTQESLNSLRRRVETMVQGKAAITYETPPGSRQSPPPPHTFIVEFLAA